MSESGDELITVDEFARRFHVDTSIVRLWVREKRIPYEIHGPRKLKRIRVSDIPVIVKPVSTPEKGHDVRKGAAVKLSGGGKAKGTR